MTVQIKELIMRDSSYIQMIEVALTLFIGVLSVHKIIMRCDKHIITYTFGLSFVYGFVAPAIQT
jgi:hypothetical protein